MGGRRRRERVEPTKEWEQLALLCRWPEQLAYEEIRPLTLFGGSVAERAQDHVLDLLGGLVDKSLVVAGTSTKGAVRYGMLEPIRQYARERLEESKEGETVRRRHATFFLTLAEEADPGLNGPDRPDWLERVRT